MACLAARASVRALRCVFPEKAPTSAAVEHADRPNALTGGTRRAWPRARATTTSIRASAPRATGFAPVAGRAATATTAEGQTTLTRSSAAHAAPPPMSSVPCPTGARAFTPRPLATGAHNDS